MSVQFRRGGPYQVMLSLVKIAGLLQKAGDRFFREFGLTQAQFNILIVLKYQRPDGCTQTELCAHMLVKGANMTGLVRRMIRDGLVTRDHHPTDERAWIVRLSRKGRQLLAEVEPEYYARVKALMGVHSSRELAQLAAQLEKTREALDLIEV